MQKVYITYIENGTLKKAVLDENMYKLYKSKNSLSDVTEYDTEMLMERRYAEKIGVSKESKKQLLD